MNQEAGADTPSSCEFSHHQIEAKYLHIGDALATLAINADIDLRTVGRRTDRQTSRLLVKRIGKILENQDCLFRSEEHTSELQSLMRISYAVFCLKKKITTK